MNKKIFIALFVVLSVFVLVFSISCTKSAAKLDNVEDGFYFAQNDDFQDTNWKYQVVVQVNGGKITAVNWNGVSNIAGGLDKKTWCAMGNYGMEKYATKGEWDVQAKVVEDYLVSTQNPGFKNFDKEGKTDAISGSTIVVDDFYDLVNKALKSKAVSKGPFNKDGWFYAEADDFYQDWKDTVLVTVVNGTIVDVLWNSISSDASKKSKLVEAREGRYGMEKIATKGEWHVQAKVIEDEILKVGDPALIKVLDNGRADAVTGATITCDAVPLAVKALAAAR
ncbi:MAG TPA: FMN-binding protein [Treponemataceae bacterium]|nr:FMN-binding protein [Treponemataceae bacterium]